MTQIHCCIDLELEQPKTNPQTPDSLLEESRIIQLGAVVYTLEPDFVILDELCLHVNIGVPLSAFIKKLTKITDDQVASGCTLKETYDALVNLQKKHSFSRVVKQWGGGDMDAFQKELGFTEGWWFGHSGCNVKHLYQVYAEANGLNTSGGLSKCLGRVGIGWFGQGKHNALNDALNTARMHHFLYTKLKPKVAVTAEEMEALNKALDVGDLYSKATIKDEEQ